MGGVRANGDCILSFPGLHNKAFRLFESMERPYSVRLSPRTLAWLAERGRWIQISKKIDDKSKADYFQKIPVLMQTTRYLGESTIRALGKARARAGDVAWRYPAIWTVISLRVCTYTSGTIRAVPPSLGRHLVNLSIPQPRGSYQISEFVKVNRIAWDLEKISLQDDAGPQAGQDLFLARLPEFNPVLDPAYRTMPFSEGKRNLDINFSVFTESEYAFGLLGFFQQFLWLAGLVLLLSGIYGGVHLSEWNWTFPTLSSI
ncbi:hypothetical protein DER46DRAFT_682978 [Fusarium sp. MPI-SDFR-AT-0072]|nr:hypothetical protein DER46DRAFT_682978 [Fusarium sp. MPI-SDFR-AT-0072]